MSTNPTLFDVREGERRKREGMARAERAETDEWNERCDSAIRQLAQSGQPFTAEQVREIAGDPSRPNAFGARLHAAARKGVITKIDYRPATRATLHSHPIAVWVGT